MEPRNVRSVMKRLVEEVASIDKQVGLLYEEGIKKTEGSGKTRRATFNIYHIFTLSHPSIAGMLKLYHSITS